VNNEKINLIDNAGLKQGVWKLYSNDLSMKCTFLDNQIIDTIKYFKNDTLVYMLSPKDEEIRYWMYCYKNDTIQGYAKNNEDGLYRYYDLTGNQLDSSMYNTLKSVSEFFPHYYGGSDEMYKYLGNSLINTLSKGTYYVSFWINQNGIVNQIDVTNTRKRKDKKLIVGVFEKMPRWQPGHQRGQMVNVKLNVPLKIK
jgi:hypothetical protein